MNGHRKLHTPQRLLLFIVALMLASACGVSDEQPDADMDSLVSAEWLSQNLDDPNLVVLDCRVVVEPLDDGSLQTVSGQAAYDSGHIPSAAFADLMGALSASESPLQFAMPSPERFAAAMGELGVSDRSRVVLYDQGNSGWAARVWWMLRWVGFDRAALLDGGLSVWSEKGLPLSTEPADYREAQLSVALRPELIVTADEVLASLDDDAVSLIDALPEAHYTGEFSLYGRPGHIPGASSVPSGSLRNEAGLFRSNDELAGLFENEANERAITYCGGGIAASVNAFVLTRLGYSDVALYAASLQEWTADPGKPMETE